MVFFLQLRSTLANAKGGAQGTDTHLNVVDIGFVNGTRVRTLVTMVLLPDLGTDQDGIDSVTDSQVDQTSLLQEG